MGQQRGLREAVPGGVPELAGPPWVHLRRHHHRGEDRGQGGDALLDALRWGHHDGALQRGLRPHRQRLLRLPDQHRLRPGLTSAT